MNAILKKSLIALSAVAFVASAQASPLICPPGDNNGMGSQPSSFRDRLGSSSPTYTVSYQSLRQRIFSQTTTPTMPSSSSLRSRIMTPYTTGGSYNPPPMTVQAPSSIVGGYVTAYMNGTVVATDHFNADGTYHIAGQPQPSWQYSYQPYGSYAILILNGDAVMLTFTFQNEGTWTSTSGSGTFFFSLTAP